MRVHVDVHVQMGGCGLSGNIGHSLQLCNIVAWNTMFFVHFCHRENFL